MKRLRGLFFVFSLFLSFAFLSCAASDDDSSSKAQTEEKENEDGDKDSEKTESDSLVAVTFVNESSYTVNVFKNAHRNLGGTPLVIVQTHDSEIAKLQPSANESGDSFYFEYNIPLGTVLFPYFSYENSKPYTISASKTNSIEIDELSSCPTKSAYIVLENASTTSLYLVNGNSILIPLAQTTHFVEGGKSAVYLAGENDEPIYYENTNLLKITLGAKTVGLPKTALSLGNVYTFTVTSESASLKSVSPFDIDTQKQIWSFDDTTFLSDEACKPVLRKSSASGSVIMGTLTSDSTAVGLVNVDIYGNKSGIYSARFSHSADSGITVKKSRVLDFAEQGDGANVMLIENEFEKDGESNLAQMLVCYDFATATLRWNYVFPHYIQFRADSANKLIRLSDNLFALAGGVFIDKRETDGMLEMHRYFAKIEKADSEDSLTLTEYVSPDGTDALGDVETLFTSAYYDGTDFYVAGYDNCDFQYSSRVHSGIVYRFSSDLTSAEEIYSYDNALFFCIDGISGDYYICGEYADAGNILKGCYISSALVAQKRAPVKYVSNSRTYCYFSGICCYGNKIIAGGKASDDFAGEANAMPIIAAFDRSSAQVLWENSSFTAYSDLGAIIPNEINTYTVQLRSSGEVHYVSADLLGNEK